MSRHLSIGGGFKPGHWQAALKALKTGGVVLLPTRDGYLLVSLEEAKLVPFGYQSTQFLVRDRKAFDEASRLETYAAISGNSPIRPSPPAFGSVKTPESSISNLQSSIFNLQHDIARLADAFVPGALTLIVNSFHGPTCLLSPDGAFAQSLLSQVNGPLYFHEVVDCDSVLELKSTYAQEVSLWIDAGALAFRPTTLVDATVEPVVVRRKGAVPIGDIDRALDRRVRLGPEVFFAVLFVCTGNTCRSAMAKAMLEHQTRGQRVLVYSAGTNTYPGMPASDGAQAVVREYGADLSLHYSTQLTRRQIEDADLILVMQHYHQKEVLKLCSEAASRTFLLTEYAKSSPPTPRPSPLVPHSGLDDGIFDPVGSPLEVFREVAKLIAQCLNNVAADIRERIPEAECRMKNGKR